MQSAFVDIGLERDAFLYVSDFLELPAKKRPRSSEKFRRLRRREQSAAAMPSRAEES